MRLKKIAIVDGIVSQDFPCRKCAYNLRGLSSNGTCPECNAPVEISISGDLLRYSDPNYLESLRRGIHLIFAGIVATIVVVILRAVLMRTPQAGLLGSLLQLAASIIGVIGSWMLTNPDPSGIGESRYGKIRQTIRVCLMVGLGEDLIQAALSSAMMPRAAIPGLQVISVLVSIANLVGQLALLEYLSRLAARIPNEEMTAQAKTLLKGLGICNGIIIVISLPMALFGSAMAPVLMAFGCIGGVVGIAALVLYIRYLVLLGKFASRFREEAAQSRLLWAMAETNSRSRPE